MPIDQLAKLCLPYLVKANYAISEYPEAAFAEMIDSIRGNMAVVADCVREAGVYFKPIDQLLEPEAREYLKSNALSLKVITAFAEELKNRNTISSEDIRAIGKALQKATGAKGKDLYMPIRVAITGRLHGPELAKALPLLGAKTCLQRIETILALLQ